MTNLFRALRTGVLLSFCFPCFAAGQMIYVDRVDPQYVVEPLVKNDRGAAQSNTKRIAAIMQRAPQGATLFFPGGDYYFAERARGRPVFSRPMRAGISALSAARI